MTKENKIILLGVMLFFVLCFLKFNYTRNNIINNISYTKCKIYSNYKTKTGTIFNYYFLPNNTDTIYGEYSSSDWSRYEDPEIGETYLVLYSSEDYRLSFMLRQYKIIHNENIDSLFQEIDIENEIKFNLF